MEWSARSLNCCQGRGRASSEHLQSAWSTTDQFMGETCRFEKLIIEANRCPHMSKHFHMAAIWQQLDLGNSVLHDLIVVPAAVRCWEYSSLPSTTRHSVLYPQMSAFCKA